MGVFRMHGTKATDSHDRLRLPHGTDPVEPKKVLLDDLSLCLLCGKQVWCSLDDLSLCLLFFGVAL